MFEVAFKHFSAIFYPPLKHLENLNQVYRLKSPPFRYEFYPLDRSSTEKPRK